MCRNRSQEVSALIITGALPQALDNIVRPKLTNATLNRRAGLRGSILCLNSRFERIALGFQRANALVGLPQSPEQKPRRRHAECGYSPRQDAEPDHAIPAAWMPCAISSPSYGMPAHSTRMMPSMSAAITLGSRMAISSVGATPMRRETEAM